MKDIIRMNQLAGIITEGQANRMMEVLNETDEFSQLLHDLNTELKTYNGEEVTYEDDPDSMEIGITIYPGYRKEEIQKSIKNILKKNKLFMIDKESIERDRDENGIMISFDIVKK